MLIIAMAVLAVVAVALLTWAYSGSPKTLG
jgi:hypothetical protein